MRLIADLLLLAGALLVMLTALGAWRMPDAYSRLQLATKHLTLGALLVIIGIGMLYPQWWSKLLVMAVFVVLTIPLGALSIARSLYMTGVKPWRAPEDLMAKDEVTAEEHV